MLWGRCSIKDMPPSPYTIQPAQEHQKDAILALYRTMLGGAADWDEHYPTMAHINDDMARGNLFVMTEGDELLAAISIDEDEAVASLPNWNPALEPAGELSRLCVRRDCQNRGLARVMMEYAFEELRSRGCKGVHLLIREGHTVALRSYAHLGYEAAGHCRLFEKDFACFERAL